MAAFNYAALATTVTALVTRFGTAGCVVKRPGTTQTDPNKPWKGVGGADLVIVASCPVLLGGISRLRMGGPSTVRGTGESPEVTEDSVAFMVGADGALARAGDYLEVPLGGGAYDRLAIEKITPLKPGGINLLWQLQLGT